MAGRRVNLKGSVLLQPMLVYLGFVCFNIARGLAEGSDYHIILQEVRTQFYFVTTFLLTLLPYLPVPHLDQAVMDLLRQAMPGEAAGMFTDTVRAVTQVRLLTSPEPE